MILTAILAIVAMTIIPTHAGIPEEMMALTDPDVHPCNDFYKYACGGWIKRTHLKSSEDEVQRSMKEINDKNREIFNKIIQKKHPELDHLWTSCINHESGDNYLRHEVREIFKARTLHELMKVGGRFARMGTNIFFKLDVELGRGSFAHENALFIKAADLTLPTSYYAEDKFASIRHDYHGYINKLMEVSGLQTPTNFLHLRGMSPADIVIKTEQRLASYLQNVHGYFEQDTINKLVRMSPFDDMKWRATFDGFSLGTGLRVKSSFNHYVPVYYNENYIKKLSEFTSLNDLQVYMTFVLVQSRAQWLGGEVYDTWFDFIGKHIKGEKEPMSRHDYCINRLIEYVPESMEKYYNEMITMNDEYAKEMGNGIKRAMYRNVFSSKWLTPQDKKDFEYKLDEMIVEIGKRPETTPKSLPMDRNDYSGNLYRLLDRSFDKEFNKLGMKNSRERLTGSSVEVIGEYTRTRNALEFSTAILQPPLFYAEKVHPARNYGAIGSMIGREITHAFDNTGSLYDKDGYKVTSNNLMKRYQEYKDRAQCIKYQYPTYPREDAHPTNRPVNVDLTVEESMADIGGVALAWEAYRRHETGGFGVSESKGAVFGEGDKMFFLAFAQSLCTKTREHTMQERRLEGTRLSAHWRVNGAVMNHPYFATAFSCSKNVRMNPSSKCQFW